jgi:hypothetical protein
MEGDTERRGPRKDIVWFLPDIKWFHEEHSLVISIDFVNVESYPPSIKETKVFAEQLLIIAGLILFLTKR